LQIVLVNDGSPDRSDQVCRALQKCHPESVVYVRLARNFGEHNAVMAGLHRATGEHIVVIDDDFQNPPEEVARLVDYARDHDYDVVYTRYARKHHSWFRNLGSRFNNAVATVLLDKPRDLYLSSFKCLNQFTAREILRYTGPYPYVDGLILRCTRNIGTLLVRHEPRSVGRSNYTLRKLINHAINMMTGFSVLPLQVASVLGLAFGSMGFLVLLYVLLRYLVDGSAVPGFPFLASIIAIFSGVQLFALGIFGEYLARMHFRSMERPPYALRSSTAAQGDTETVHDQCC